MPVREVHWKQKEKKKPKKKFAMSVLLNEAEHEAWEAIQPKNANISFAAWVRMQLATEAINRGIWKVVEVREEADGSDLHIVEIPEGIETPTQKEHSPSKTEGSGGSDGPPDPEHSPDN